MDDCELSSLELYESDWVCVKTGIFDKQASNKNNNINNWHHNILRASARPEKLKIEKQKNIHNKQTCLLK